MTVDVFHSTGSAAITLTDPLLQTTGTQGNAPGSPTVVSVSSDGIKPTYRYTGFGFTPLATPTDWLLIQGSATKTIRVKFLRFGGVATANGNMPLFLIRRSSSPTLGGAVLTAVIPGKHDPVGPTPQGGVPAPDPAATAVVSTVGTGNIATLGTANGTLGAGRLFLPTTATGTPAPLSWDLCVHSEKAIVLRGVTDYLCVNGNGAAVPAGGVFDFEIVTEEDNS